MRTASLTGHCSMPLLLSSDAMDDAYLAASRHLSPVRSAVSHVAQSASQLPEEPVVARPNSQTGWLIDASGHIHEEIALSVSEVPSQVWK